VLRRIYKFGHKDISAAVEALLDARNVAVNRPAVDAGLAVLKAGGDFADGLIAYEGSWLGGDTFVSFDKRAVSLIAKQGQQALSCGRPRQISTSGRNPSLAIAHSGDSTPRMRPLPWNGSR
jgi:hypothetical protein